MPCTTWPRARKFDCLGPPPLRGDNDHLWGRPNLSKKDQLKVVEGNQLLLVTLAILNFCTWVLESPWTSRAWLTRPLQHLQRIASLMKVDYCQFGMPWRKATGLLVLPAECLRPALKICSPKNQRCSASGRKHTVLQGTDTSGQFLTLRAQPYPVKLCRAIACALKSKVS